MQLDKFGGYKMISGSLETELLLLSPFQLSDELLFEQTGGNVAAEVGLAMAWDFRTGRSFSGSATHTLSDGSLSCGYAGIISTATGTMEVRQRGGVFIARGTPLGPCEPLFGLVIARKHPDPGGANMANYYLDGGELRAFSEAIGCGGAIFQNGGVNRVGHTTGGEWTPGDLVIGGFGDQAEQGRSLYLLKGGSLYAG